ncbi:hypothetical protein SCLARK_001417 [Spiroplasma clarkii]|uniref:Uncharacterized protein n=1 Tax=Spiroplasma clarkii TaxID=2139 RepID=A0A1Y0L1P7_9MOLU|nr:hypothetical protein SCLARK_001417 [Spiroplasma clarkii]ATX71284.1 hypothetical protein SCLAR_v1c09820 [Spiroplasma clarkii]
MLSQPKHKDVKVRDDGAPRQLSMNNQIKDINIYTIKNSKQKIDTLVFKDRFNYDVGFRIINAQGFNSFGLKEEVDLIFCNRHHQVIDTYTKFKINKFTQFHEKAVEVFVLAKNMIKYLNISINDQLKLAKY